jgi:predicted Co/Zn/Cd cation transporter (cation efflux family)
VAVFAITIASILVLLTIGTAIAGIVGRDISTYFAILTSIMTSMISALVGYLAGKGQGKSEQPPIIQVEPPAQP